MLPPHIKSHTDLVTTRDKVREGFLRQAFRKTQEAQPYLKAATILRDTLRVTDDVSRLVEIESIQRDLLTAAGFSAKAINNLTHDECKDALAQVLETIAIDSPEDWRDEIMFRYLLTQGDSLGGRMRNIVGAAAAVQFTDALRAALERRGVEPTIVHAKDNPLNIQEIHWPDRVLLFNKKPSMINKNIDAILCQTTGLINPAVKQLLNDANRYVACGELKGGIDPAGADEHWKTAGSALERIRVAFANHADKPSLFFCGAAIEDSMAREIFAQLNDGRLGGAANLTAPEQVDDLADWLVNL